MGICAISVWMKLKLIKSEYHDEIMDINHDSESKFEKIDGHETFEFRLERNDLPKFIWGAENSLRAVEHMDTVSSECLEND
ncbi:hypothetical protein TNCV_3169161 [Trichonephila clavipes]|nr:hypothetical protein TNCV_3169161 [Trichonephila clavipes]